MKDKEFKLTSKQVGSMFQVLDKCCNWAIDATRVEHGDILFCRRDIGSVIYLNKEAVISGDDDCIQDLYTIFAALLQLESV